MIQAKCCKVHDETIEKYAMGRISQQSLARFEEHLLLCESCQNQVTLTDAYLQAMRSALHETATCSVVGERRRARRLEFGANIAVRLPGNDNSIWAKATDRSEGGFGLTLGVKLRKGARVVLALGRSLYEGRVAWCAGQGAQYRIGVRLSA
jgi:hypothetical protein